MDEGSKEVRRVELESTTLRVETGYSPIELPAGKTGRGGTRTLDLELMKLPRYRCATLLLNSSYPTHPKASIFFFGEKLNFPWGTKFSMGNPSSSWLSVSGSGVSSDTRGPL